MLLHNYEKFTIGKIEVISFVVLFGVQSIICSQCQFLDVTPVMRLCIEEKHKETNIGLTQRHSATHNNKHASA